MYHPGNKYMLADDLQTHIMPSNMILEFSLENVILKLLKALME